MGAESRLMSSVSPFALFDIEPTYSVDWDVLESKRSLFQKTLHPDLFPAGSADSDIASSKLSCVNNAYRILKDPLHRARALFELKQISIPGENGATISNPEMMEEALFIKESLEEAAVHNDFSSLFDFLNTKQKDLENIFNKALLENNEKEMTEAYIRLSFCVKTLNDAKTLCFNNMGA